jgi:AbiTii
MDETTGSNLKTAKELSDDILSDIEIHQLPISQVLMKTERLARLLHDSDAQKWLDYELTGYPPVFDPAELGTCRKYFSADRPVLRDERTRKPRPIGMPQLESYINATKLDNVQKIGAHENQKIQIVNRHHEMVNDFERLKTAVHNYVTEVNIALSVGEKAEGLFEDTRVAADRFIREHCPRAGEELLAISEKLDYYDPESFSEALLAVRKILVTVADAVVPVQEAQYRDRKGRERKIGPDQYLNRIFSYLEQNAKTDPFLSMIEAEMSYLLAKADHPADNLRGLYEPVSRDDVELAIIHMYLVVAEIAKIKKVETVYLNTYVSKGA